MTIDLERASTLLNIVDKARQWPELRPLHDEALNELRREASKPMKAAQALEEEKEAHNETKAALSDMSDLKNAHDTLAHRVKELEDWKAEGEPSKEPEPEPIHEEPAEASESPTFPRPGGA